MSADRMPTRILVACDEFQRIQGFVLALASESRNCEFACVQSHDTLVRAASQRRFDVVVIAAADRATVADWRDAVRAISTSLPVVQAAPLHAPIDNDPHTFTLTLEQALEPDRLWRAISRVLDTRGRLAARLTLTHDASDDTASAAPPASDSALASPTHDALARMVDAVHASRPIACVHLDIDHYHKLSLTYGQAAADEVRDAVAQLVQEQLAPGDDLSTTEFDRIVVLQPGATELDAWLWADEVRRRIAAMRKSTAKGSPHLTVSAGVADAPAGEAKQALVEQSTGALALAKQRGRNQVCTQQMVATLDHLRSTASTTPDHCESRREDFLNRLWWNFEPVKREHITSHCEAVARMSIVIAREMNFSERDVDRIRMAGLLHDIGKCMIPEALLAKAQPLTAEEWQLMSRHDIYGGWIATRLGAEPLVVDFVQRHHQRYDNTTVDVLTPLNDSVSMGAAILSVADALVTMLSTRTYRRAMTMNGATSELERCSGEQFDPAVVSTVLGMGNTQLLAAA